MDSNDIVGLVAVIAIFLVPSLGLTARFALKPIVDSVLRVREALDRQHPTAIEDSRVTALQHEVYELREAVDRLTAAAEFDAQLRAAHPAEPVRLPGTGA